MPSGRGKAFSGLQSGTPSWAVAMASGPEPGLRLMAADDIARPLERYHLLHSARADLHRRMGNAEEAARAYRRALELVSNEVERTYLTRRLAEVEDAS